MNIETHRRDAEITQRNAETRTPLKPPRTSASPLRLRVESYSHRRSARRSLSFFKLALALSLLVTTLPPTIKTRAQVRASYDEGAVGLGLALRRLQTTASVLHVAAHPDDEDSALIAELARGQGARVGYLSLNRGEGGQNRIGAELFDALGVIRTEELLQARRLDGGEQFFARTYDFGFTKTLAESRQRWDEREVLADMVRVIRLFRPLVIVSRWQGTPADGHGQHQYAGYLAPKAFRAAGDPAEFPEQIAEGLRPWQPLKFYVSANPNLARANNSGANANDANAQQVAKIETGDYDPLLGRSAYELAMEGRSQHKSQGEGGLQLKGEQSSGARLVERVPTPFQASPREQTIFDGLDTSIRGIARVAGLKDDSLNRDLQEIQTDAATALERFVADDPRTVLAALTAGLAHTRQALRDLNQVKDEAARDAAGFMLEDKEHEFGEALRLALGVRVDALADSETVGRGDSLGIVIRAYVPDERLAQVDMMRLRGLQNSKIEPIIPAPKTNEPSQFGRERATRESYFRISIPETAEFTQPYWLKHDRKGDLYEWDKNDPQTLPFARPPFVAEVDVKIGGERITIEQPVEYRYLDDVRGEVRREVNVVPEIDVQLTPALVVVPRVQAARGALEEEFTVPLRRARRARDRQAARARARECCARRVQARRERRRDLPSANAPRRRALLRLRRAHRELPAHTDAPLLRRGGRRSARLRSTSRARPRRLRDGQRRRSARRH
ncbi:MAG: PIG-L family deacetylase [Acidobacteria bacterium]|nr:PIG-L family deacetylase [Acidobacteriota bacterium]